MRGENELQPESRCGSIITVRGENELQASLSGPQNSGNRGLEFGERVASGFANACTLKIYGIGSSGSAEHVTTNT